MAKFYLDHFCNQEGLEAFLSLSIAMEGKNMKNGNYVSYRTSRDEMSSRAYNMLIGAVLLWGFVVNAIMCTFFADVFMSWNIYVVLIGYFVIAFFGIHLSLSNDDPFISFIGYNLVVLPVGVVLSIFISLIETTPYHIMNTIIVTGGLTIFMILAAMIFPDFFEGLGHILFLTLLGIIIVEFITIIISKELPTWWDLGVAAVFCFYIGYDWAMAQDKSKTADNAIDTCVALYLDIINLFMRLLSSSSKSKSSRR